MFPLKNKQHSADRQPPTWSRFRKPDPNGSIDDSASIGTGQRSSLPAPVSANRGTRLVEKETLSSLNDRLAVFIDRMRQLERENERLGEQLKESEIAQKRAIDDLVAGYKDKVRELRMLVDDAYMEKTRVCMDAMVDFTKYDCAVARVDELEKELEKSEKTREMNEASVRDLQGKLEKAEAACRCLEDEKMNLSLENNELNCHLRVLREQVENATLNNTAILNQNQAGEEGCKPLKEVQESQMGDTQCKLEVETTTTACEIERMYESRLQDQLQAMRTQFDRRLKKIRREVDETYKKNMNEANEALERAVQEAVDLRMRIQELEKPLKTSYGRSKINLQAELDSFRERANTSLKQKSRRITQLEGEISRISNEYQDLTSQRIHMDAGLKVYSILLEGAETGLDILQQPSQTPDGPVSNNTNCGVKRKRLDSSNKSIFNNGAKCCKTIATSLGSVEIEAHDMDGKSITLVNKSNRPVSISGWKLRSASNSQHFTLNFSSQKKLEPGNSITVYSGDAMQSSMEELNLRHGNNWPAGDCVRTTLFDERGNEVADRCSMKEIQGSAADVPCVDQET